MGKVATKTKSVPNTMIKEPSMYKVIYLNDESTTIDFVVETLMKFFNHSDEGATGIAHYIHEHGSGVAGIFPYEVAEQKGVEVTRLARAKGFPLVVKLEADE